MRDYAKALSSVVAEERYEQRTDVPAAMGSAPVSVYRVLLSDFLLVAIPGTKEWMPFRDVYTVDSRPVRDRNDRVMDLFVNAPADAYAQALRIRDESSRYNIGSGTRDTNVPTFALQILDPAISLGFRFRYRGSDRLQGLDVVVIEFEETAVQTLIVGQRGERVPSKGRFWIEPATGRVVRTKLETKLADGSNSLEVTFREEPKLGLWVPGEMDERRTAADETLEGRATYRNFRSFQVNTAIEIK